MTYFQSLWKVQKWRLLNKWIQRKSRQEKVHQSSTCSSFWLTTYLLCLVDMVFNRQSVYPEVQIVLIFSQTCFFIRMRQTSYTMSTKHNKYVVNQKLEHVDDISFRKLFGRIRVGFFYKIRSPFLDDLFSESMESSKMEIWCVLIHRVYMHGYKRSFLSP
jgi:hypothetical protein